MSLNAVIATISSRYAQVRCALDVGLPSAAAGERLRSSLGGTWRSIAAVEEFPFEDSQFEVVVIDGAVVSKSSVRETHRVLKPEGCMVFAVAAKTRKQDGYTLPEVYRLIREGFDIVSVAGPKWWHFGGKPKYITVCARKKAWRDHKGFVRDGSLPFVPFRSRT